ncbi:MAG: NlpC/P60 family protein [Clostridia bacterium]
MEVKRRKRYNINRRRLILIAGCLLLVAVLVIMLATLPSAAPYEPLIDEDIQAMLTRNTELGLSTLQDELVRTALSIVGDVHYFWGGKSNSIGRDPAWGELREVSSSGSESSGTMRPYGLDCSGYVTWCVIQLGYTPSEADMLVGNGTWNQWDKSKELRWNQLAVGDIAFMNRYPTDKGNHIGICVGFTEKGEPLFAHCALGFDNVVVTPAADVFRYARRPAIFN